MEKHTPGPWKIIDERRKTRGKLMIYSDQGKICQIPWLTTGAIESEANAALIAAAPELLAACQVFVAACDKAPPVDLIKHIAIACEQARVAITKAEREG